MADKKGEGVFDVEDAASRIQLPCKLQPAAEVASQQPVRRLLTIPVAQRLHASIRLPGKAQRLNAGRAAAGDRRRWAQLEPGHLLQQLRLHRGAAQQVALSAG